MKYVKYAIKYVNYTLFLSCSWIQDGTNEIEKKRNERGRKKDHQIKKIILLQIDEDWTNWRSESGQSTAEARPDADGNPLQDFLSQTDRGSKSTWTQNLQHRDEIKQDVELGRELIYW